jgi:hypothetical protein
MFGIDGIDLQVPQGVGTTFEKVYSFDRHIWLRILNLFDYFL